MSRDSSTRYDIQREREGEEKFREIWTSREEINRLIGRSMKVKVSPFSGNGEFSSNEIEFYSKAASTLQTALNWDVRWSEGIRFISSRIGKADPPIGGERHRRLNYANTVISLV